MDEMRKNGQQEDNGEPNMAMVDDHMTLPGTG